MRLVAVTLTGGLLVLAACSSDADQAAGAGGEAGGGGDAVGPAAGTGTGTASGTGGGAGCQDGSKRCVSGSLETCSGGVWGLETDCAAEGQVCRDGDPPGCEAPAWTRVAVVVDDPVEVGQSLNVPIDGVSFAHDPGTDALVTAFDRSFDEPADTHLWHLALATGTHQKRPLTGDVFAPSVAFCVGEQWCQHIGFDPVSQEWVVAGPAAPALMRVGASWSSGLVPVTGSAPPASFINHTHRFAWPARTLFLYGAVGPSSFGSSVYALHLDSAAWSVAASGLPAIDRNCLAFDAESDTLYSVGGQVTDDGGETTETVAIYQAINVTTGSATSHELPAGIGARRAMSCVVDGERGRLYAFGGAVIEDRFDEAQNTYHNDLWSLDLTTGEWEQLLAGTPPGTLGPPDSYGDRPFDGDPSGPNFGANRGYLHLDATGDRLLLVGAVPRLTHEQLYTLSLGDLSALD